MAQKITCRLCVSDIDSPVILFKVESLAKCKYVLAARKRHCLKFGDISLPEQVNDSDGYHYSCYKKFTAIKAKYLISEGNDAIPSTSSVDTPCTSRADTSKLVKSASTGVLEKVCLFCEKECIVVKGCKMKLHSCETKNFEYNIKEYAKELKDEAMLNKIQLLDFIAKEVKYHNKCRVLYQNKYMLHLKSKDKEGYSSAWHKSRMAHKEAFASLCAYINETVFGNNEVYYLIDLHIQYKALLLEFNEEDASETSFTVQHLEIKLQKHYSNTIVFTTLKKNRIVMKFGLEINEVALETMLLKEASKRPMREAAYNLRRSILSIQSTPITTPVTVDSISKGECTIPCLLIEFLSEVICGPKHRRKEEVANNKVKSIAQDIIYLTSNGRIRPAKQLLLGLGVKSLTDSRKLITILNHYNQCVSYNVVEELETEMTYAADDALSILPKGLMSDQGISTGLAFDNFDRYVETLTGKETLHDTVGIVYQDFVPTVISPESEASVCCINPKSSSSNSKACKRFQRTYQTREQEPMEMAPKKPKLVSTINTNILTNLKEPSTFKMAATRDTIWMISLALKIPNTPMWIGYNSKTIQDSSAKQIVAYLPQINLSPTSSTVVLETIKKSVKIAEECNQKYAVVTYDLAIAKIAYQIQSALRPTYDKVFIMLGAFHIMMSYFKAIGKFIDDCGITYIMIQSELLASGSLQGFISGKHFNRCKRLHPMLASCLSILNFETFLKKNKFEISNDMLEELELLQNRKTPYDSRIELSLELSNIIERYETFFEECLNGIHGKTAQYYALYIQLIKYYLILSRSIRTGDFNLYRFILPKISNIFFSFNHHNYARWTVKFSDNLLRINDTHPGLEEVFKNGLFGIKRTENAFSRSPIDLVLEQTINADAANKLTGILQVTNSISARQRWAKSHSQRTEALTHLFKDAGITKIQDVTPETKQFRVRKDSQCVNNVLDTINGFINPFDDTIDKDVLYNIVTGRAASDTTASFLLNIEVTGAAARKKFISECSNDPSRFEKAITRQNIHNFSNECVKTTRTKSNGKLQELKMEKDLFARMLAISLSKKLDVSHVLSYPITPVPPALCHNDGNMHKTDKAALMHILENRIVSESPSKIDVKVFDGFFLLHLLDDVPKTFGKISIKILQSVCKSKANNIHIIFDQYHTPSIKDAERNKRSIPFDTDRQYAINGPDQVRPVDFNKSLRNSKFKEALVNFLVEHWESEEVAPYFASKTVYITNNNHCYSFTSLNGKNYRKEENDFYCSHEEADTRIAFHIGKLQDNVNVVVRTSDTDVLIILLANYYKIKNNIRVWMEVGTVRHNNLRYISIHTLSEKLGVTLCKALPGFHALTGCDYTAAFFRKGKKTPFKILENSKKYQKALANMADVEGVPIVTDDIQEYICRIYGVKSTALVDEAREIIFSNTYTPKKDSERFMKSLKAFDYSCMPPCFRVVQQKIKRAHYVSNIWSNADKQSPTNLMPENCGWLLTDGKLTPLWYEGDQAPPTVADVLDQGEEDESAEETDEPFSQSDESEED